MIRNHKKSLAISTLCIFVLPVAAIAAPKATAPKAKVQTSASLMSKLVSSMSRADQKTYAAMSPAEKSVVERLIEKHAMDMAHPISGTKAPKAQKMAMMCPHCDVAMVNGKCPMCGMTEAQAKKMMGK